MENPEIITTLQNRLEFVEKELAELKELKEQLIENLTLTKEFQDTLNNLNRIFPILSNFYDDLNNGTAKLQCLKIETKQLTIKDSQGTIECHPMGLVIINENGQPLAFLGNNDKNGALIFFDKLGNTRLLSGMINVIQV